METVFEVRVNGPLAGWADRFHADLMALGYAPRSAQTHLLLMRPLSRWLDREGLAAAGLRTERIKVFLVDSSATCMHPPAARKGRIENPDQVRDLTALAGAKGEQS